MRESSKTKSMDITLPLFTTAFCFVILLKPVTSVNVTYEVISGRMKSFRVRCTSTGGRVLNMYVTGPDFNSELSNIQAVGTLKRMGNDIYTATTATIKGSGYPQTYNCTASNGASYLIDSVELTDDSFSTTKTLKGGNSGQFYNCTASNGVSSLIDSVELKGDAFVLPYT